MGYHEWCTCERDDCSSSMYWDDNKGLTCFGGHKQMRYEK